MREDERRRFEYKKYQELKVNRKGSDLNDGSVLFYAISAEWIERWKGFVSDNKPIPGEINNLGLKSFILKCRAESNYP